MAERDYTRINKFIKFVKDTANDNSHGYSQLHRWGPDYDCSSMTYAAAYYAGYNVKRTDPRYTGSMIGDFTKAGWTFVPFDGNLGDIEPGDILLNTVHHVAVAIGDGLLAQASQDEEGGVEGRQAGDQTGLEIHIRTLYNYPWTHVGTPPKDYKSSETSSKSGSSGQAAAPAASSNRTRMNGIDVSNWQAGLEVLKVPCDFVIAKATEGTTFKDAYMKTFIDAALKAGKPVGVYHFAIGGDAVAEADYFLNYVKPYIGKAMLILDWEGNAVSRGVSWAKTWLDYVKAKTGITPVFYSYNNEVKAKDWSSVAKTYPLWNAGYFDKGHEMGYTPDAPLIGGTGAWNKALMYQYTSEGVLPGWGGHLDLDVFYGSKADWQKYATGGKDEPVTEAEMRKIAQYVWEYAWADSSKKTVKAKDRLTGTEIAANAVNNAKLADKINAVPGAVWEVKLKDDNGKAVLARRRLIGIDTSNGNTVTKTLPRIEKKIDELTSEVNALDTKNIAAQVQASIAELLKAIDLDVTVKKN